MIITTRRIRSAIFKGKVKYPVIGQGTKKHIEYMIYYPEIVLSLDPAENSGDVVIEAIRLHDEGVIVGGYIMLSGAPWDTGDELYSRMAGIIRVSGDPILGADTSCRLDGTVGSNIYHRYQSDFAQIWLPYDSDDTLDAVFACTNNNSGSGTFELSAHVYVMKED
jgi:hypothetical protein